MALNFWTFVHRHLRRGRPVFCAHVAHNTHHSPGTMGAHLAVADDGTTEGTIGGGVMEANVLEIASRALEEKSFSPRLEELYHRRTVPKGSKGKTSGLGCAGSQTNVYHVVEAPRDLGEIAEILSRLNQDRPGLVHIDSQGLRLEDHKPTQIEPPLRFRAEDPWEFSIQLLNWKRVAVVGGGHCGLALSRVMKQLGYTVTVIDNRRDVFTFTENEYADFRIAVDDYVEANTRISHRSWTHVVVMTANVDDDIRALSAIAEGPYPYIGVMGAPAKLAHIRAELEKMGIPGSTVDGFYAPVGLEMTSNTPEEIAISVAAEILRERKHLFPFTESPSL